MGSGPSSLLFGPIDGSFVAEQRQQGFRETEAEALLTCGVIVDLVFAFREAIGAETSREFVLTRKRLLGSPDFIDKGKSRYRCDLGGIDLSDDGLHLWRVEITAQGGDEAAEVLWVILRQFSHPGIGLALHPEQRGRFDPALRKGLLPRGDQLSVGMASALIMTKLQAINPREVLFRLPDEL